MTTFGTLCPEIHTAFTAWPYAPKLFCPPSTTVAIWPFHLCNPEISEKFHVEQMVFSFLFQRQQVGQKVTEILHRQVGFQCLRH